MKVFRFTPTNSLLALMLIPLASGEPSCIDYAKGEFGPTNVTDQSICEDACQTAEGLEEAFFFQVLDYYAGCSCIVPGEYSYRVICDDGNLLTEFPKCIDFSKGDFGPESITDQSICEDACQTTFDMDGRFFGYVGTTERDFCECVKGEGRKIVSGYLCRNAPLFSGAGHVFTGMRLVLGTSLLAALLVFV